MLRLKPHKVLNWSVIALIFLQISSLGGFLVCEFIQSRVTGQGPATDRLGQPASCCQNRPEPLTSDPSIEHQGGCNSCPIDGTLVSSTCLPTDRRLAASIGSTTGKSISIGPERQSESALTLSVAPFPGSYPRDIVLLTSNLRI